MQPACLRAVDKACNNIERVIVVQLRPDKIRDCIIAEIDLRIRVSQASYYNGESERAHNIIVDLNVQMFLLN